LESLSPSNQQIILPSYDEVDLSPEEEQEALRLAREAKHYRTQKEQYWNKINAGIDWTLPNARELFESLRATKSQTGKPFEINEGNKKTIQSLCLYFAGDAKFCDAGKDFSLDKGILLLGIPGIGKTHLMDFFNKNPHASYILPTCKTIVEKYVQKYTRDDMSVIEYYSTLQKAEFGHIYNQEYLGICFGDLGAEADGNSYGNRRNVIEEIIFNRYEAKLPFKYTHFTSNLDPDMIKQKYGERLRDRLREMCNVFVLNGKSFR
jgi:DNA replication protein DnaC